MARIIIPSGGSGISAATQAALDAKVPLAIARSMQSADCTIVASNFDNTLVIDSSSPASVTVPTDATLGGAPRSDAIVEIVQLGTGQVTVTPAAGVNLRRTASFKARQQNSSVFLRRWAVNDYILTGDLAEAINPIMDNFAVGTTAGTAATTLTWAHTVAAGASKLLLISVGATNGSTGNVVSTSLTYGGIAMTKLMTAENTTQFYQRRAELWYLLNPVVGTANVVVTADKAINMAAISTDWHRVNQTTPFRTTAAAPITADIATNVTTRSVTTSGGDIDDVVVAFAFSRTTVAPVAGGGQTVVTPVNASTNGYLSLSTQPGASGTVTSTYSITTAADVLAVGAVAVRGG